MFSKILNSLTFFQWIKLIGIIIASIFIFGISKDTIPIIEEQIGLTNPNKNDSNNIDLKTPINNIIPISNKVPVVNKESKPSKRKLKIRFDFEYELASAETNRSSPPPVLAMLAAPPLMLAPIVRITRLASPFKVSDSLSKIEFLWSIYCSDPDFSTECEINNHD